MKLERLIKVIIATVATIFLATVFVVNFRGASFSELKLFEMIEMFIAVPLFVSVFYWLFATKFDEFTEKIDKMFKQLDIEEAELSGSEKTLRQEIIELREVVDKLDKDISKIKKKV